MFRFSEVFILLLLKYNNSTRLFLLMDLILFCMPMICISNRSMNLTKKYMYSRIIVVHRDICLFLKIIYSNKIEL